MLSDKIYLIRHQYKYSQEKFAEKLQVSRQAVQRWENGTATPDLDNMINISRIFNASLDWLNDLSDHRSVDEMRNQNGPIPSYQNLSSWESYAPDMMTDYKQALDEGKDAAYLQDVVEAVCRLREDEDKEAFADLLFKILYNLPLKPGYPYKEPDDLSSIRLLRTERAAVPSAGQLTHDYLRDKLKGAWLGRVCGCMLGQPVECITIPELHLFLKETDNFPLHRYITSKDVQNPVVERISFPLRSKTYADMLTNGFPGDDDTNYTFMASCILERYGRNFTSDHVCDTWKQTQVMYCYATAEKVAYRNMIAGYYAPGSAQYKNPFREWIGAQIRGDYFGYINPGDPESAAGMAWRDARVSHVKNGIYGEMFVAAMNAAAMVCDDPETVILCGMSQIPATSRLYEKLQGVLDDYHSGMDWYEFFKKFNSRYDEYDKHTAVHTIPNAELVTAALLWGEKDYTKTIGLAVQCGYDTDCNGATAGSIIGMIVGTAGIDEKWTKPIGGLVNTSVYNRAYPVDEFVDLMLRHISDMDNSAKQV